MVIICEVFRIKLPNGFGGIHFIDYYCGMFMKIRAFMSHSISLTACNRTYMRFLIGIKALHNFKLP
jgi:hypothetical protein